MSEPRPRSHVGSRIAHYEVIARLGAGGMGEVYRARFEREARVLGSINHPQIGSVYGIESAPGVRAIGALPEIGQPQELFVTGAEAITGFTWHQYDITKDDRFLVNVAQPVNVPVTVLLNWLAASGQSR